MKIDTARKFFDHKEFIFDITDGGRDAGPDRPPWRRCDRCGLSGVADIHRCAGGARLCSACRNDLMGLPAFTQRRIGEFLIGNVL